MSNLAKKGKAANWLKAIAALIAYLAGLLTGNSDVVSNLINF